ncbi:glyoxylase-like metal-dependent hydrolase (beta-lactamase superfamily II) [Bradyrhizobium sp. LM3.6]
MTDLNRRHLLAGAAAVGAAAVTGLRPTIANAAVPQAGTQAPGFYRYKVGSYECTSINDGARTFPMPDKFVVNAPKEEALAAGEAAYMPKGMVTVPFNPQLINTGSKLVLIDTGNGVANLEPSKGAVGRTLQNLQAAGIDPKSIDVVLLSHLHPDHTNGIRLADGALAFPNAEIMVPGKDWEFWTSEDNAAKAESNPMMKNYFANVKKTFAGLESKVTKYDWGKEVAPGITSIATPGHTPGHTLVRGGVRRCQGADPVGCHQHSGILRSQSGLACRVRHGWPAGTSNPPQILRHGGGREGDRDRLPLHLPLGRSCREGWRQISPDPVGVEPDDLSRVADLYERSGRHLAA